MPYTVTIHDEKGNPFETRTFDDQCAALSFMEARQAALPPERRGVADNTAEGIDSIRRTCLARGQPSSPPPLDASMPPVPSATGKDGGGVGGADAPPPEEENPASVGAPDPKVQVELESSGPGPGEDDGRTLNEQAFDPGRPMPDYDLADLLRSKGSSDEEVEAELERLRRNLPPPGEPHPMFSLDDAPAGLAVEDPVILSSGQFTTQVTDVLLPSPGMPLHFTRSYRSGPPFYGPLGFNWDHAYNMTLRPLASGGAAVWTSRHSEDVFRLDPDGNFESPTGIFARLIHEPATAAAPERYRLQRADRTELLFERPAGWPRPAEVPLLELRDASGNAHTLDYYADGRLKRVADGDGRTLDFSYDGEDRIAAVGDHTGRTWTYAYDEELETLASVTTPPVPPEGRGLTTCYEYDREAAHPALVHNLKRILDPGGRVVVENNYESDPGSHDFGRVVRQVYGGHTAEFHATRLQYVPRGPEAVNVPALRVETCGESGYRVCTFNYRGDLLDERFRLVADGSYRIVARSYAYDRQGNRIEAREPNGMVVRKTFDAASADPRARGNLLKLELGPPPTAPLAAREVLTLTYETRYGQIKTVRRETGATTDYVYDYEVSAADRGDVVRIDHPVVSLADGTVQKASETFVWDNRGRISRRTSAEGHVFSYEYHDSGPSRGLLRRTVAGLGREGQSQTFDYDLRGNLTQVKNAAGVGFDREYDALGRLLGERRPAVDGKRGEVRYRYGPDGSLVGREKPGGALAADLPGGVVRDVFEHDVLGRLCRMVLCANTASPQSWSIERTSEGLPRCIVGPVGEKLGFDYDERQLLLRQVQRHPGQDESRSRFVYDRQGNLTAAIDPTGVRIDQAYDPWGRLSEVLLPGEEGRRTRVTHTYAPGDRVSRVETVGPAGTAGMSTVLGRTEFDHDARGRLVSLREGGREIRYVHDRDSQLISIRHHRGSTLTLAVDALGRLRSATDALSNRALWHYDAVGDLVEVEEHDRLPDGTEAVFRTQTRHDDRGRPWRITDPLGNETHLEYDDRDLLLAVVDPLGQRSEHDYDPAGNLVAARSYPVPNGPAHEHLWQRDALGRVVVYRSPEGHETRYAWAGESRWASLTLADGAAWVRELDAAGRVLREVSPAGIARLMDYDRAGLPLGYRVEDAAGAALLAPVVFEHDGLGRLTAAVQDGLRVEWSFDDLGRVVREATDGQALTWSYDDAAGRADVTWPDGRTDRHEFDELGRLKTIRLLTPAAAPQTGPLAAGTALAVYEYFGPERLHLRRLGNGTTTRYAYDAGRRLVGLSHRAPDGTLLAEATYAHDAAGRRRLVRTAPAPGRAVLNGFDAAGRLVAVHEGVSLPAAGTPSSTPPMDQGAQDALIASVDPATAGRVHIFALDPDDGRRACSVAEGGTSLVDTYTLAPTKAIRQIDRATNGSLQSAVVDHDDAGLRLRDDRYAYGFDPLGRLVSVSALADGRTLLTQEYDPIGRPCRRMVDGADRRLLYHGARLVQETDETGAVARQHTFGLHLDEIVVQCGGGNRWGHQDGRNTLLAVSDDQGTVLERYACHPFGRPRAHSAVGAMLAAPAAGMRPVFGGHSALGMGLPELFDARARVYDADTGHYLQRDRLGAADSANAWLYAAHNPADLTDPSGEVLPIVAALVIIGAVAGAGYSLIDAIDHPERYRGGFSARTFFQVAGGAAVGGLSALMGESVLGAMGLGGGAGTQLGLAAGGTLTLKQTFAVGATVSAMSGFVWRAGFQGLFPEYVDPPSAGTMATDYVLGGVIGLAFRAVEAVGNPFTRQGRELLEMNLKEAWQRLRIWNYRGAGEIGKAEQVGRGIAELRVGRQHAGELEGVGQEIEGVAYRVPGGGQTVVFNAEVDVVTDSAWIQVKAAQTAARAARVDMNQAEYTFYGAQAAGKRAVYYVEPGPNGLIPRETVKQLGRIGITDVRPLTPELRGYTPFPLPHGGASGLPYALLPFFLLNPNGKREPGQWAPAAPAP